MCTSLTSAEEEQIKWMMKRQNEAVSAATAQSKTRLIKRQSITVIHKSFWRKYANVPLHSVADPDPHPYVFGPLLVTVRNGSRSGSFHSSQKENRQNLDFYCFVTSLWLLSLKNDVNIPVFRFRIRIWILVFGPPGSASRSVSQRYGSEDPDPDPYKNVTDPQYCKEGKIKSIEKSF